MLICALLHWVTVGSWLLVYVELGHEAGSPDVPYSKVWWCQGCKGAAVGTTIRAPCAGPPAPGSQQPPYLGTGYVQLCIFLLRVIHGPLGTFQHFPDHL